MFEWKRLIWLAVVPAFLASSCGGSAEVGGSGQASGPSSSETGAPLSRYQTQKELSNAFRAGLYRLAVMSQPKDNATDLGQTLPTGLLESLRCSAEGPRDSIRCEVRWQTVDGEPRLTAYRVRFPAPTCFDAFADPPLPARKDNTIGAYSESPLNILGSSRPECS